MIEERVALVLDNDQYHFLPGERLSGRFWLAPEAVGKEIKRIEVSVGWRTEGKGDEDAGVHHSEDLAPDFRPIDPIEEHRFETRLPLSPLSYDGHLVKIHWRVLVQVHFRGREHWTGEAPFWLGDVRWPPQEKVQPLEQDDLASP
ncbi:hypothetical protein BH23PLA1_BH23PLA1_38140 [soil metagenome]